MIERELLAPLPSLRASIGRLVTRKVDRLSCVRFGSARYSVPVRLIGETVGLRTGDGRLLVIVTGTGLVVAEHVLVARVRPRCLMTTTAARGPRRGGRCGRRLPRRRRSARSDRSRRRSSPAPPRPGTPGWAELAELNTLRAAHGEQVFGAALSRAVAFGRWRAADVRSILAAGPGRPTPGRRGTRWSSSCPSSRSARCRTTPSAGCHDRGRAAAGSRPDRGPAAAETGRDARLAPELLLTARTQRWAPEELLRTLVEAEISARDASTPAPASKPPRSR